MIDVAYWHSGHRRLLRSQCPLWHKADIACALHMSAFGGKADAKTYNTVGKSGHRVPRCRAAGTLLNMHSWGG